MGIYMQSSAMLGVRFKPTSTRKEVVVRGCDHPETNHAYCSQCGKQMWIKETETVDQFEYISDDLLEPLTEELDEKFNGRGVVAYGGDWDQFFFGYGATVDNFECKQVAIADAEDIRRDLKEVLEKHGIWDQCKDSFGFWAISVGS